jgi:FixJ family two-component response regulator
MPQTFTPRAEIFVMDDDAAMRETLSNALQQEGFEVTCFADGDALLSLARARVPVCIFLEVGVPGSSGLDVLKKLHAEDCAAPVFAISARANIPMAVDAIRNGAHDFIEKPIRSNEIIARIKAAIGTFSLPGNGRRFPKMTTFHFPGCESLTRREREVLAQLALGASNKEAAQQLGLSFRTIEGHRANIMKKVGAKNAAELIRRILGDS